MTLVDEFDLLVNVECFLRRGHASDWGTTWDVHREHADDFEAYLNIIKVPYRRVIAATDCGCPQLPTHRNVVFIHACSECDPVAARMFEDV